MSGTFDRRLAELAARGDRAAFGELVVRHQAWLRGTISRFVADSEEVFDLAQTAFLEAYRSLARFDPELDFAAWLRGIAVNVVRGHLRSESRLRARELRQLEEAVRRWRAERLAAEGTGPDRLDYLRECVATLDPESRSLVEKRYFEGLALPALAEEARKSAGALAMQFLRIRTMLAQCVRGKLETAR
jgi:RNA polymerase sigma-70 factor (ECF subfamily)